MIASLIPQIVAVCTAATSMTVYFTKSKREASITRQDADILWKLHKRKTDCHGHKIQHLTLKNGQIKGFKCECGYRYIQKRPLLSQVPQPYDTHIGQMRSDKTLTSATLKLDTRKI